MVNQVFRDLLSMDMKPSSPWLVAIDGPLQLSLKAIYTHSHHYQYGSESHNLITH